MTRSPRRSRTPSPQTDFYFLDWRPVGGLPFLDRETVRSTTIRFADIAPSVYRQTKRRWWNSRQELIPHADAMVSATAIGRNDGFFVAHLRFDPARVAQFRIDTDLDELARIACLVLKERLGHTHVYHNLPNRIRVQPLSPATIFRTYPVRLAPAAAATEMHAQRLSDAFLRSAEVVPKNPANPRVSGPRLAVLHVRRGFFRIYESFCARLVRHRQTQIRFYNNFWSRLIAGVYGLAMSTFLILFLFYFVDREISTIAEVSYWSIGILSVIYLVNAFLGWRTALSLGQIRGFDQRRIEALFAAHGYLTLANPVNDAIQSLGIRTGDRITDFSSMISGLRSGADRELYSINARLSWTALALAGVGILLALASFVIDPDTSSFVSKFLGVAKDQVEAAASHIGERLRSD